MSGYKIAAITAAVCIVVCAVAPDWAASRIRKIRLAMKGL